MRTVNIMGREFPLVVNRDGDKEKFYSVYEKTLDPDKGMFVVIDKHMPTLIRYRQDITLSKILSYFKLYDLLSYLQRELHDLLNYRIIELQGCKLIAPKRDIYSIIDYLKYDNMILRTTKDASDEQISELFIYGKYNAINEWMEIQIDRKKIKKMIHEQ